MSITPPTLAVPSTALALRDAAASAAKPAEDRAKRAAAMEFEAAFLAEMLTHAGLGRTPEAFGGGPGEDAFASLLVREQARDMAEAGGIGLADAVYKALRRAAGEANG